VGFQLGDFRIIQAFTVMSLLSPFLWLEISIDDISGLSKGVGGKGCGKLKIAFLISQTALFLAFLYSIFTY